METRVSQQTMKRGDHIYIWRTLSIYAHHGIYVGNAPNEDAPNKTPMVIHFVAQENSKKRIFASSSSSGPEAGLCLDCMTYGIRTNHGVHKCCLKCFLQSSQGHIHRYEYGVSRKRIRRKLYFRRGGTCSTAPENGKPKDVISRAEHLLQNGGFGDYNLFDNNCERFAVYCKTKRIFKGSAQVQGFWAGLVRAVTLNIVQVDWHHIGDEDNDEEVEVSEVANRLRNNR